MGRYRHSRARVRQIGIEVKVRRVLRPLGRGLHPVIAYRVRAERREQALAAQPLHDAYVTSVGDQFEPARALAMLLVRRMTEGKPAIDTGPLVELARTAIVRALRDEASLDNFTIDFGEIPGFPRDGVQSIDLSGADVGGLVADVESSLCAALPKLVDETAKELLSTLKADWVEGQCRERVQRIEHRDRLRLRWSPALPLYELELAVAARAGQMANDWLRNKADDRLANRELADALTRLHARACQVGNEVLVLLANGLADGAFSRWRTLHELAVVAWFIAEQGNATARRYLDHVEIDAVRLARTYRDPQVQRSWQPFSDDEWDELIQQADHLCEVYGPEYRGQYGWAATALGNTRPTFSDIEHAVRFSLARPQYKMASDAVHAGPRGTLVSLGNMLGDESVLLTGPSNAGLDEPGRLAAISLAQVTTAVLTVSPFVDGLVWARAIGELSLEVVDAFDAAAKKLVHDQERIERRRRRPRY